MGKRARGARPSSENHADSWRAELRDAASATRPTKKAVPIPQPALGFAYQVITGMLLFTGLGWYLDRRRGGGYALTLGGMFLGLLYMAYETWKLIRIINRPPASDS